MKRSGFREWILVSVFIVGMSIPLYAQPTQLTRAERQHLDSLLYAVDFDQLRMALKLKEAQVQSLNVNEETWVAYRQQVQGYARALETIFSTKEQKPDYIEQYVKQRLGQEELHQAVFAGHPAAELYDAFVRLVQDGAYARAVGYYEAARFFRTTYLLGIEHQLATYYNRALAAYELKDFRNTRGIIDSVSVYFGSNNVSHQLLIARLKILRANADRLIAEEERERRAWRQSERPLFRGGIALSGQVITRSTLESLTLQLHDLQSGLPVSNIRTSIERTWHFSYNLEAYVFLGSHWALGGGFSQARYSFSNESDQELFFFDIDLQSQVAYAFARYALRPEVGVRPYLLAGGGVVHAKHKSSEATIIDIMPERPPLVEQYRIEGETQKGMQAGGGIGVEYITCRRCSFVIGTEFSRVRNFLNSDFIPAWQSLLSFRIGLYL